MHSLVSYYDEESKQTIYVPAPCYFAAWRIAQRFKEEGKKAICIFECKESV